MPDIGSRREVFWDDLLVDRERTTAARLLHSPARRECVLTHDCPWEGDGCDYHNIVADDGLYRLYYLGWRMFNREMTKHTTDQIRVCYAESRDGVHWVKPSLGLCEYEGSKDNNILLDNDFSGGFDNFFVFKDKNPACPPEERYKAVYATWIHHEGAPTEHILNCALSSDGIRFRKGWPLTRKGLFDSLNTACYDEARGLYHCYLRDFHATSTGEATDGVRDIRHMTSPDFKVWTEPEPLDFMGKDDYPLYTNVVSPYARAPHVLVGFPSRYVERKNWTKNFDRLAGAEMREKRCKLHPRYGLTTTDCVFMCSRDGQRFTRYDEAFMRPGAENPYNWVYGDCYPAVGLIETETDVPGESKELSLYAMSKHWSCESAQLWRYAIRLDGFVSLHAGYRPERIVTNPFRFEGGRLLINFSTSAIGYLRVAIADKNGRPIDGYESCELFGDSTEREVDMPAPISALAGREVRLFIELSDADLYAFQFLPIEP